MNEIQLVLLLSGTLFVFVVLGMRVAFAAALIGMTGLMLHFMIFKDNSFERAFFKMVQVAGLTPHSKLSTFALALIPIFILIGYLAYYAGFTKALFVAAKRWLGWLPGGLALSTIFATAGFAAVSGASVATSAVFARIAIPEMLKLGYAKSFAAGAVAAGGTLASLIPPSAILVVYAIINEVSVGKLLLAGFLPGIFSALIYALLIIGRAAHNPQLAPRVTGFSWQQRFATLPGTLPVVAVVLIIMLSIITGWATPTEAGGLGAFIVLVMALINKMRWPELKAVLLESAKLSAMIFTIIWGVLIYVRFLGFAHLPQFLSEWIVAIDYGPYTILLCVAYLCHPWHVHGCNRYDDSYFTCHFSCHYCAQRRYGCDRRSVNLRHEC